LGDFADNLRKVRNVEKRLALETLKAEIADPARDRRRDFVIPSDWQVITMLTGESPATLRPGIIVAATVQRLTANDALLVLDSKIEGHVKLGFIANPDVQLAHPGDVLVKKQIVRAVCIDAKPADFFFEFSTRPIDMLNGDDSYRTIQRLEPYDLAREAADKEALQKKKKRETEKMRRQIDHPNFFNFSASQAEQHLVNMQRGDAVIRPSSKGIDRLALTWKVDDDLYQHIGSHLVLSLSDLAPFSLC
jgi:transcription elongation factor SPT6